MTINVHIPVSPQDSDPDNPLATPKWYYDGGPLSESFVSEVTFETLPKPLVRVHRRCRKDGRYWFLAYVGEPGIGSFHNLPPLDASIERLFACEVCGEVVSMKCGLA